MQDFFNPVGQELVLSPARKNYLPDLVRSAECGGSITSIATSKVLTHFVHHIGGKKRGIDTYYRGDARAWI